MRNPTTRILILTIRITKKDKEELIRGAAANNMSVSAFARKKMGFKKLAKY